MRLLVALATAAVIAVPGPARAQEAVTGPAADTAAVGTLDGIISALYASISGPAGERDWSRVRSLLLPGAVFMNAGPRPDGRPPPEPSSFEEYRERAAPYFREAPYFEVEIARTTHRYGTVAQVWSTYETRREADGEPFARGINSIVVVRHDGRWYIASVIWDAERPDDPIPEAYLPAG